ncbi:MAG: sugar nucleotide-binding protein [Flavobacteriaceae bacterium]
MIRVLIVGGSGFLGRALFKELHPYMDVYATYCHQEKYTKNKRYFSYDINEDSPTELLRFIKPHLIISALRGDAHAQFVAHDMLIEYAHKHSAKLILLSSANVFDSFRHYPSYEHDKTLSESAFGKLKITLENKLMRMPAFSWTIARLPMVFGSNSPRLQELKTAIHTQEPYEIFPNSVINVASDYFVTQQLHYIINRNRWGIFHLGSNDLVHHDAFVHQLVEGLQPTKKPVYKHVFASNQDRYIAVLPKYNTLPNHLAHTTEQVLADTLRTTTPKKR